MSDPILLLALDPDVLSDALVARVRDAAPDMRVELSRTRDRIEALLSDVHIAVGQFPRDLLPRATSLVGY